MSRETVIIMKRRKTEAAWVAANPIIPDGQTACVIEANTGRVLYTKTGNGRDRFNDLLPDGGSGVASPVSSVAGRTGAVTLTSADVQLSHVNDTSDANKPISTATSTALGLKLDASAVGTAAAKDIPATGNASATQVVYGSDTRLTDGRVDSTARSTANAAVVANAAIAGATKTKVTYDAKGLVTGGADATTADIADSANKRYVTDAMLAGLVPPSVRPITAPTDSLVIADAGQTIDATEATEVTIPPNSGTGGVAFEVGTEIGAAASSGAVTVVPGAGVTLLYGNVSKPTGVVVPAGQGATLIQTAANVWKIMAVTLESLGLNNVTNDAQTKAAVVPNTAPAAGQLPVGNAGGTAYAPVAMSGDGTLASTGALTVTKINGTSLAGLSTGILKNTTGTGVPSIAALADLPGGAAIARLLAAPKPYVLASGAQTVALDCTSTLSHVVTGHASGTAATFTIANAQVGDVISISFLQGAVVSTIDAWFATVRWTGGTQPTLTATVSKRDTFVFVCTGINTFDGGCALPNC